MHVIAQMQALYSLQDTLYLHRAWTFCSSVQ